jgi:uncharacterized damage-inducible protein DinB
MTTKVVQSGIASPKLIERWEQVCQKLAALAEEVPTNQFNIKPADGARTVSEILRHVAFWNCYVADSARGRKANETANELSREKFSTKAQIINELRRSAVDAADALKESPSGLSTEVAEMVVTFIEHNCEHYGQLTVYARLKGIIPPASRG